MKAPLRLILKKEISKLKEDTPYSLYDIMGLLTNYPQFNKNYKIMAIQKCIVNNPQRTNIGELGDLLYFKGNKYDKETTLLYKYDPKYKDIPIYRFDGKLSREKALLSKQEAKQRQNDFLNSWEPKPLNIIESNNQIAIINSCSLSKIETSTPIKASQLYIGKEFNILKRLKLNHNFDHYIISAKYGLISSEELILPYDKTFLDLTLHDIDAISPELKIREHLELIINSGKYKMIFLILGNQYMRTLQLKKPLLSDIPIITFLLDKNSETHQILKGENIYNLKLDTAKMIKRFENYGAIDLKMGIIEQLFKHYDEQELIKNPKIIKDFLNKGKKLNSLFII